MAKPPAGSSLLFGALADFGRIKQRKNGSYRMVLKGIDDIDWFTDRPDRAAGVWSPKRLVKKWDRLFGDVEPNAQATFDVGGKRELATFEMFKPKLSNSNQKLSFNVRGIGKKNKDLLTGLKGKQMSETSLFIDDASTGDERVTMTVSNDSGLNMQMNSLSDNAVFGEPVPVSGYTDPYFTGDGIGFTGGEEMGSEGVFEVPVTLKNGLQSPPVDVTIDYLPLILHSSRGNAIIHPDRANGPTTVYFSLNGAYLNPFKQVVLRRMLHLCEGVFAFSSIMASCAL